MPMYLVTGGCGFIGSHLVDALVARGNGIRILDDLSTGKRQNRNAAAELIVGDVADQQCIRSAMAGVDGCFHLAAIASVERATRDWLGAHRTNLSATIAVFDAARRPAGEGPLPVVYASSAAVYGQSSTVPTNESAIPRPLSAYGADKLGCELHARVATGLHGVPTIGLRFFNVFGPRQDPSSPYSGVISKFVDRVLRRQPLVVFGDGNQLRDFVHVSDVVSALIGAMDRLPISQGVLNVCSGKPTSILDLIDILGQIRNERLNVEFQPARNGDIRVSLGDPLRAEEWLGFRSCVNMEYGLRELLGEEDQRRRAGACARRVGRLN